MVEEKEGSSQSVSSLFMELASETRFSILTSLSRKSSRLSSLSRELNTTVQDIFRNVSRMAEEGLIRKVDGEFFITEYGSMIMNQVPYFNFVKKHREFLETHTIANSGIPDKFQARVGELAESEIVGSATEVFQRLKKLELSANSTLKAMVSQAWPEEGEIFIDRITHMVQVQTIVGHNTIIPKIVVETVIQDLNKLIPTGFFNPKMIEKVFVGIYLADDAQAALMFPRSDGEVDMTTLFVSEDKAFCGWCSDLFDYFWQGAKNVDINKLKVVD